jgi:DNA-binding transcriptional LysR family regulator
MRQQRRCEPIEALIAADHPLATRASIDLTALAGSPFILFETGFALNPIILEACRQNGFTPAVAARSSQIDFIIEHVAAKLGVGFLPRMIAAQRKHPGVRHIGVVGPTMEWHMALIWRRGSYLPHAAQAWLALASDFNSQHS